MTSPGTSSRSAHPGPGAVITLAALALLSGCAVGPDFHRPAPLTVSGYTRESLSPQTASAEVPGGEAQRFRHDQDVVEQWWTLFQSPALNAVVEQALQANPTIVSAQAALRQARALVDAQRGFFYPTVQGSLYAAGAQIGVAIANLPPQFTISATYGGTATDFAQMFAHHNPYWMVGGTALQMLFDGNTLWHRQRVAAAAFEQAAAQYRSTVLTALQNVADTLYALQADAESLTAAVAAERAAKRTLDITLKQQQLGHTNYLALLSAQQAYQQTVITRVQAQASRFADTGALFLALGGGWWNRPDDAATQPADQPSQRH